MSAKSEKELDHLALGLTRSPMFAGVNIRLFFANLVGSTLICIDAHTFWGIPLFLMLHLIMVKLSTKDPNFFTIRVKAFLKTPPVLNYRFWGKTNSYGPW
jgi:type IV secretory pathway VirB3-like protein